MFRPEDLVSSYSRKRAIEDGTLIDVSETAREAGVKYPTALTSAAWSACVKVPEGVVMQDEDGRLWGVLYMFRMAAAKEPASRLLFTLYVRNDNLAAKPTRLKAICGPGDDAAPVVTIMLPEED